MDDPLLENGVVSGVAVDGAGVGAAAGDPTVLDRYSCIGGQRFLQPGNNLVAVVWVHCRVLVTMEELLVQSANIPLCRKSCRLTGASPSADFDATEVLPFFGSMRFLPSRKKRRGRDRARGSPKPQP